MLSVFWLSSEAGRKLARSFGGDKVGAGGREVFVGAVTLSLWRWMVFITSLFAGYFKDLGASPSMSDPLDGLRARFRLIGRLGATFLGCRVMQELLGFLVKDAAALGVGAEVGGRKLGCGILVKGICFLSLRLSSRISVSLRCACVMTGRLVAADRGFGTGLRSASPCLVQTIACNYSRTHKAEATAVRFLLLQSGHPCHPRWIQLFDTTRNQTDRSCEWEASA